nr:hypothetical protein [uncultured Holophaga sp.]
MNSSLRSSSYLALAGGCLVLVGLLMALVLLPDAHRTRTRKQQAAQEARKTMEAQQQELKSFEELSQNIRQGRQRLEELEAHLPQGSVGSLQWALSGVLHQEAAKAGVRLLAVKFGMPSREGAKGTELESLEVEFTSLGVYPAQKKFMFALETAELPFAVATARLEESPEGARLAVTLRAFRKVAA